MRVALLKRTQIDQWMRLRGELWPDCPADQHRREVTEILAEGDFNRVFVAVGSDRKVHGFLEASIRLAAEGCRPGRIGYIEGWYVEPRRRGKGVGAALAAEAEAWAASNGCKEMASDSLISNDAGIAAHQRLGYEEVERLVHFRKELKAR
jgi:aminoglycoside 6'-N-acetyltransferase I